MDRFDTAALCKMPLKKLCHLRVKFTNRWFSIDRPFRRRNSPKSAMSERAGILITEPCMVNPPMNLTPECRLDFPSQLRGVVAHNLGIGKCLSIVRRSDSTFPETGAWAWEFRKSSATTLRTGPFCEP